MAFSTSFTYEAINKMTPILKKIKKDVIAMSKGVEKSARKTSKSIDRIGKSAKKNSELLSSAGSAINTKFTLPFIAGSTAVAIAGGNYEASLLSLMAITGLTEKQMAKLSPVIQSVGDEFALGSSSVAKGMELIGSNQPALLENSALLLKVGRSAAIMAKASGLSFAEAGDNLTGIMNQFDLTGESSDRAMNVLAAGAKFGAATIPQISESMRNIGPAAKDAGLSIEQTVSMIELMSLKGKKGSEAGTALRSIFTKLSTVMGDKFNPALVGVSKAMENVSKLSKKQLLKSFGEENVNNIKILIQGREQLKKMTKSVTGSQAALEQSSVKMKGLNFVAKKLWSVIGTGAENAFDALKPVFMFIISSLKSLVVLFSNFAKNNKTAMKVLFALGLAVSAVGFALTVLGGILGVIAGMASFITFITSSTIAMAALTFAITTTKIAVGLLTAMFNVSPLVVITLAVLALVAAYFILKKAFTAIMPIMKGMWAPISATLKTFKPVLDTVIESVKMLGEAFGISGSSAELMASIGGTIGRLISAGIITAMKLVLGLGKAGIMVASIFTDVSAETMAAIDGFDQMIAKAENAAALAKSDIISGKSELGINKTTKNLNESIVKGSESKLEVGINVGTSDGAKVNSTKSKLFGRGNVGINTVGA